MAARPGAKDAQQKDSARLTASGHIAFCLPDEKDTPCLRIDTKNGSVIPVGQGVPQLGTGGEYEPEAAVLARDGAIYTPPGDARRVLRLDLRTGTATSLGPDLGDVEQKYWYAVAAPDGRIYCPPMAARRFLRITPASGAVEEIGPDLGDGGGGLGGAAVFAPDGRRLICAPLLAPHVVIFDVLAATIQVLEVEGLHGSYWCGAISTDGRHAFFPPYGAGADRVLRIDLRDGSGRLVGPYLDGGYSCICRSGDGALHCPPFGRDGSGSRRPLRIDHLSGHVELVGQHSGSCRSALRLPDGSILCAPWEAKGFIRLGVGRLKRSSERLGPDLGGGRKYGDAILGADGCAYSPPYDGSAAHRVIRLDVEAGTVSFVGPNLGGAKYGRIFLLPEAVDDKINFRVGGAFATSDRARGVDQIGYKRCQQALFNVTCTPSSPTPMTIGLNGTWGTGKSKLMDMLREEMLIRNARHFAGKRKRKTKSSSSWFSYFWRLMELLLHCCGMFADFLCPASMKAFHSQRQSNAEVQVVAHCLDSAQKKIVLQAYREELEKVDGDPYPLVYIPVWFNSWIYSGSDHLWAGLITEIQRSMDKHYGYWYLRCERACSTRFYRFVLQPSLQLSLSYFYFYNAFHLWECPGCKSSGADDCPIFCKELLFWCVLQPLVALLAVVQMRLKMMLPTRCSHIRTCIRVVLKALSSVAKCIAVVAGDLRAESSVADKSGCKFVVDLLLTCCTWPRSCFQRFACKVKCCQFRKSCQSAIDLLWLMSTLTLLLIGALRRFLRWELGWNIDWLFDWSWHEWFNLDWLLGMSIGGISLGVALQIAVSSQGPWRDKISTELVSGNGSHVQGKDFSQLMGPMRTLKLELNRIVRFTKREHSWWDILSGEDLGRHEEEESCDETKARKVETRFMIFVDDLDRCPKHKVVEVLQALVLLQEDLPFTIYLAMDLRAVAKMVEESLGETLINSGINGVSYIDKIVQLPFTIPRMSNKEKAKFLVGKFKQQAGAKRAGRRNRVSQKIEKSDVINTAPFPDDLGKVSQNGVEDTRATENDADDDFKNGESDGEGDGKGELEGIHVNVDGQIADENGAVAAPEALFGFDRSTRVGQVNVDGVEVSLSMSQEEQDLWLYFAPFIDPNARRIIRLLNIYNVAKQLTEDLCVVRLLKTLILFEQWSYRASWLTQIIEDDTQQSEKNDNVPGVVARAVAPEELERWAKWTPSTGFLFVGGERPQGQRTQLSDNMPLSELFGAIEEYFWDPSLWESSHDHLYADRRCVLSTDSDPEVFDALLRAPPQLTVADLRPDSLLLKATINRNIALEGKVAYQASQRVKWSGFHGEGPVKYRRRTEILLAGYLHKMAAKDGCQKPFEESHIAKLDEELDERQRVTFQQTNYQARALWKTADQGPSCTSASHAAVGNDSFSLSSELDSTWGTVGTAAITATTATTALSWDDNGDHSPISNTNVGARKNGGRRRGRQWRCLEEDMRQSRVDVHPQNVQAQPECGLSLSYDEFDRVLQTRAAARGSPRVPSCERSHEDDDSEEVESMRLLCRGGDGVSMQSDLLSRSSVCSRVSHLSESTSRSSTDSLGSTRPSNRAYEDDERTELHAQDEAYRKNVRNTNASRPSSETIGKQAGSFSRLSNGSVDPQYAKTTPRSIRSTSVQTPSSACGTDEHHRGAFTLREGRDRSSTKCAASNVSEATHRSSTRTRLPSPIRACDDDESAELLSRGDDHHRNSSNVKTGLSSFTRTSGKQSESSARASKSISASLPSESAHHSNRETSTVNSDRTKTSSVVRQKDDVSSSDKLGRLILTGEICRNSGMRKEEVSSRTALVKSMIAEHCT